MTMLQLVINAVADLNGQQASQPILSTEYGCGGAELSIRNCSTTTQ